MEVCACVGGGGGVVAGTVKGRRGLGVGPNHQGGGGTQPETYSVISHRNLIVHYSILHDFKQAV